MKKKFVIKDIILGMIKDDLINSKLVLSLNEIGVEASYYHLHASVSILKLTGIKAVGRRWEKIHDGYLNRTRKILQIDVQESPLLVDALAEEIYSFLNQCRIEEQAFTGQQEN